MKTVPYFCTYDSDRGCLLQRSHRVTIVVRVCAMVIFEDQWKKQI